MTSPTALATPSPPPVAEATPAQAGVPLRDWFAGQALVCVKTTGIFCRLTCPARTPKRANVEFRALAAECLAAGFRACKRCRPV